jgi:serine protease
MPIRPLLVALLTLTALAVPAGATAAADDYVPGEVIVKYEDDTNAHAASTVEKLSGTDAQQNLPGGSERLAIEDGDSVPETISELRRNPNVAYAVPNWKAHAAAFIPNDPDFGRQWNLFDLFGINMPDAWELAAARGAPGGRGAVVAVLDSGVAYERYRRFRRAPDLRAGTFVKGFDFIDHDRHPNDEFGHGTHVAGTIAQATNNGLGTAGIAYGAKIMPLRVLDSLGEGDSAAIARAIRYAARAGANVINLSLEFPARVEAPEIPEVLSALRFARRKGAIVVAAAGNRARTAVAYPARAEQVMAVGATTIRGCEADYSNAGKDLDVVAPGGGIDAPNARSQWDLDHCRPDSPGRPIIQQTFTHDGWIQSFGLRGPLYEGTSMAAPHVAAVAALVIASGRLGPNPSPRMVEEHLEATARDAGDPGFDPFYGYGIVDAAAALR